MWRSTCGERRSSGRSAAAAWRPTIRAMSRVLSAAGLAAAGQREQQLLGGGGRADLDPGDDRVQRVVVERDGARAAALAVADGHPPAGRALDRLPQPRVARAPALVDVADHQRGRLRRAAGRPSRAGATARGRACPGGCGGRACAAAAPTRRARARAARRARRAPSGPCAAARRRRAPRRARAARTGAWPPSPVSGRPARARRGRRAPLQPSARRCAACGPEEGAEGAVDGGVGAARLRRALAGGDLRRRARSGRPGRRPRRPPR